MQCDFSAPEGLRGQNEEIMRTTSNRRPRPKAAGEMRAEYKFNYAKARPNRFAARMKGSTVAVVLDPDVASVFQSSKAVNSLLRSVISALPQSK